MDGSITFHNAFQPILSATLTNGVGFDAVAFQPRGHDRQRRLSPLHFVTTEKEKTSEGQHYEIVAARDAAFWQAIALSLEHQFNFLRSLLILGKEKDSEIDSVSPIHDHTQVAVAYSHEFIVRSVFPKIELVGLAPPHFLRP